MMEKERSTEFEAGAIANWAERYGCDVSVRRSRLSDSCYLALRHPSGTSVSIRVATHGQSASHYRPVDFEVGPHAGADFATADGRAFTERVGAIFGMRTPGISERRS